MTVPPRTLITTIAPASVACRVMVYAALCTTPIVIFTLITVDLFCATSTASFSPVGRGWIVTVSFPGSDATWAWRQTPRGWLPWSPIAMSWGYMKLKKKTKWPQLKFCPPPPPPKKKKMSEFSSRCGKEKVSTFCGTMLWFNPNS